MDRRPPRKFFIHLSITTPINPQSIIVWRSGRTVKNSILFKHDFPVGYYAEGNFDTDCTTIKVPDLKYCEDTTFWDHLDGSGKFVDRSVLISCDANRKSWNTVMGPLKDPEGHGSLWVYEPTSRKENPARRKVRRIILKDYPAGHDFHPLSVEVYPSYGGKPSNLYVINHARARTVIEQFTLSPSAPNIATHVRTISSPFFISPNSLALTSPDSFYVTNDHLMTRRLPIVGNTLALVESVLALPLGFVTHVTLAPKSKSESDVPAIQFHKLAVPFIPFANGITISPDGTHVAVASTSMGQINIYKRDTDTNSLTLEQTVPTPHLPDNIVYTHDGSSIIVGGHPNFPDLIAVAKNTTGALAPSWIVSISITQDNADEPPTPAQEFDTQAPVSAMGMVSPVPGYELKTLFQSDGSGFLSSSSGLVDPITGALYISGLYAEEGLLICQPISR